MIRRRLTLGVTAVVVGLDQALKLWMLDLVFDPPRRIEVLPFFNLIPVWNRGVSFGLLSNDSALAPWLLTVLALAVVGGLLWWLRHAEDAWTASAVGLVVGGAAGNVVDRVRFGAVIDFVDLHALGYHWYTFNLADAAISVGAAMFLLGGLVGERLSPRPVEPK
jgi:signal peptidase II